MATYILRNSKYELDTQAKECNLRKKKLRSNDLVEIARYMMDNPYLEKLDLSQNEIIGELPSKFLSAIAQHKNLQTVLLNDNYTTKVVKEEVTELREDSNRYYENVWKHTSIKEVTRPDKILSEAEQSKVKDILKIKQAISIIKQALNDLENPNISTINAWAALKQLVKQGEICRELKNKLTYLSQDIQSQYASNLDKINHYSKLYADLILSNNKFFTLSSYKQDPQLLRLGIKLVNAGAQFKKVITIDDRDTQTIQELMTHGVISKTLALYTDSMSHHNLEQVLAKVTEENIHCHLEFGVNYNIPYSIIHHYLTQAPATEITIHLLPKHLTVDNLETILNNISTSNLNLYIDGVQMTLRQLQRLKSVVVKLTELRNQPVLDFAQQEDLIKQLCSNNTYAQLILNDPMLKVMLKPLFEEHVKNLWENAKFEEAATIVGQSEIYTQLTEPNLKSIAQEKYELIKKLKSKIDESEKTGLNYVISEISKVETSTDPYKQQCLQTIYDIILASVEKFGYNDTALIYLTYINQQYASKDQLSSRNRQMSSLVKRLTDIKDIERLTKMEDIVSAIKVINTAKIFATETNLKDLLLAECLTGFLAHFNARLCQDRITFDKQYCINKKNQLYQFANTYSGVIKTHEQFKLAFIKKYVTAIINYYITEGDASDNIVRAKQFLIRLNDASSSLETIYCEMLNIINSPHKKLAKDLAQALLNLEGSKAESLLKALKTSRPENHRGFITSLIQSTSETYLGNKKIIPIKITDAQIWITEDQSQHLLAAWKSLAEMAANNIKDADLSQVGRALNKYNSRQTLMQQIKNATDFAALFNAVVELNNKCSNAMGAYSITKKTSVEIALGKLVAGMAALTAPTLEHAVAIDSAFKLRNDVPKLMHEIDILLSTLELQCKNFSGVLWSGEDMHAPLENKYFIHGEKVKSTIQQFKNKFHYLQERKRDIDSGKVTSLETLNQFHAFKHEIQAYMDSSPDLRVLHTAAEEVHKQEANKDKEFEDYLAAEKELKAFAQRLLNTLLTTLATAEKLLSPTEIDFFKEKIKLLTSVKQNDYFVSKIDKLNFALLKVEQELEKIEKSIASRLKTWNELISQLLNTAEALSQGLGSNDLTKKLKLQKFMQNLHEHAVNPQADLSVLEPLAATLTAMQKGNYELLRDQASYGTLLKSNSSQSFFAETKSGDSAEEIISPDLIFPEVPDSDPVSTAPPAYKQLILKQS